MGDSLAERLLALFTAFETDFGKPRADAILSVLVVFYYVEL